MKPKTLYHQYRNCLSDYKPDIEDKKWHPKYLEKTDSITGEITKGKPLYVFNSENISDKMSIDDKSIGHEGYTIFSNGKTGKIAMMIASCKSEEVGKAISLFGSSLQKIKIISCDMAAGYLKVCNEQLPDADIVIDKFHVMQYVYDAVLEFRTKIKKELSAKLSKGKHKTLEDKEILFQLDLLKHSRYRLTQSSEKWNEAAKEVMELVFEQHPRLRKAYDLAQWFKQWYHINNCIKSKSQNIIGLYRWYSAVKESDIGEFKSVVKMIRKHEREILNYFICGQTNARAERLNGKINRFVANNFGMKDVDFALYRIANYFS